MKMSTDRKAVPDLQTFDLATVGGLLREAREAKDLSVEDAAKVLFLRKSLIRALESGNWDRLPHPVYVRGYLNQYAGYLKIQEKVAEYLASVQKKAKEPAETETERAAPLVEVCTPERSRKVSRLPVARTVVYAGVAAFLVAFFVFVNMERPRSVGTGYEQVAKSSYGRASYDRGAYEPRSTAPAQGTIVLEPKKLLIACQERTWVRIVIDETEKKEFMLNPQEMVAFNGKEGFDLLIGNAGGVKLYYNGADAGFSGESGQVKRVKLP